MPDRVLVVAKIATAAIGISFLLSGCGLITKQDSLSTSATHYNLELERAQNQMLLLNIVRASMYRPKHMSAITQFRRASTGDLSSEFTIPFGGGGDEKYLFKPTLKTKLCC